MNKYDTIDIKNTNTNKLIEEIQCLQFKINELKKKLNYQKIELNNILKMENSCNEIIDILKKKMEIITEEIDRINNLLIKLKKSGTVYIYWDIENMPVKKNNDVSKVVSNIYSEVKKIYVNNKIVINCYFEKNSVS